MTVSAQYEDGPPEGMTELRSDPIFLSQFLRLALPPIDAVATGDDEAASTTVQTPGGAAYMPPSVGTPAALKTFPKLEPWISEKTGKPFVQDLTTMLSNMDEVSAIYSLSLPPPFPPKKERERVKERERETYY